jgi:hypothetical protein
VPLIHETRFFTVAVNGTGEDQIHLRTSGQGPGVNLDNTKRVNPWAAFGGRDENAVVDGDFAVIENELANGT